MDQDQLRAILRTIIADRAQAGKSLADVGRVLAQEINPTRPPFSRQYVHMLANGKTRITEAIGAAIATLAAMQVSRTDDDIPDSQAGAQLVTTPICSLRAAGQRGDHRPGPPLPAGRLSRGDHRPARLLRTGSPHRSSPQQTRGSEE